MPNRIFTAVHSHRHGASHYVFTVNVPAALHDLWVPTVQSVIDLFDIEYEPNREEWIEVDYHGEVLAEMPYVDANTPDQDSDDDGDNEFSGHFNACAHWVKFNYFGFSSELHSTLEETLTSDAESRAKELITKGYIGGDLDSLNPESGEEIRGWWQIVD